MYDLFAFKYVYNNFIFMQMIKEYTNKSYSVILYAIFLRSPKITIIFFSGAFIKPFIMVLNTCNTSIWKVEAGE